MNVFLTGTTGWVGSALVDELVRAGHRVTGLVRPGKAVPGPEAGCTPRIGTLDDLGLLHDEAARADAVIHTAFNHDFTRFAQNCEQDRRAIEALGSAWPASSSRRLLVTGGIAQVAPGRLALESDLTPPDSMRRSEAAARDLAARGIATSVVRLAPTVHGVGDHGFIAILAALAREKGVSAYVGDGQNRWPAVHRLDAARVYRLALDASRLEPVYHAIAEEGVAFRQIAEAIGRRLGLPCESREPAHFGWFAAFAAGDFPADSRRTREGLGWAPTGPGLLADLGQPGYLGH